MIGSVDFFDRFSAPSLPRMGDTAYPTVPSGARATAGLSPSWDTRSPVVYAGDGTSTQADLNGGPIGAAASAVASVLPSPVQYLKDKADAIVNHTLLGALGVLVILLGLYILVKE